MQSWKKLSLCLIASSLLWVAGTLVLSAADKVFIGEIGDSQCAMGVHSYDKSHETMLKQPSVGKTATDCTLFCIKNRGGRFVLQTKKNVYRLDNQDLAGQYPGKKVKVTGTLDPQTETIQVRSIEPIQ